MIEIYVLLLIGRIPDAVVGRLLAEMQEPDRDEVNRLRRKEDVDSNLMSYYFIRKILSNKLGINAADIKFSENKYGKPYLKEIPNYHFNLSHSGKWIVAALDSRQIGIDVEQIKPIDMDISLKYFSRKEHGYLAKKEKGQKLECFYDFWTLKESYIKAIGRGLSLPLDSFSILPGAVGGFTLYVGEEESREYCFKQYRLDPEYKLSVCSQGGDFPPEVKVLNIRDII